MRHFVFIFLVFLILIPRACSAEGTHALIDSTQPASIRLSMNWQNSRTPSLITSFVFNGTSENSQHTISPFTSGQGSGQAQFLLTRGDAGWPVIIVFSAILDGGKQWNCDFLVNAVSSTPPADTRVYDDQIEPFKAALAKRGRTGLLEPQAQRSVTRYLLGLTRMENQLANDTLPGLETTPEPPNIPANVRAPINIRMLQQTMGVLQDLSISTAQALEKGCAVIRG